MDPALYILGSRKKPLICTKARLVWRKECGDKREFLRIVVTFPQPFSHFQLLNKCRFKLVRT